MAAQHRRYSFGSFPAARRRRARSFRLHTKNCQNPRARRGPRLPKAVDRTAISLRTPQRRRRRHINTIYRKAPTAMQNAAYPPQYNAGAQPVPMPEQVGYYAAPAMLGGPVPGRPSYVLPQAPSVGSWPLPPARPKWCPAWRRRRLLQTKSRRKSCARRASQSRWNRDEERD